MNIEGFVIIVISIVVLCRLYVWVKELRCAPDPWSPEIQSALESQDAVALCQDCLTPQQHNGWFCPECGAAVGKYCNYLPGVYVFSMGEGARSGVTEHLRVTGLIVVGYLLVAFHAFSCLAPLSWIFLFKNIHEKQHALKAAEATVGESL